MSIRKWMFVAKYCLRYRVGLRYALWAHGCAERVAADIATLPIRISRRLNELHDDENLAAMRRTLLPADTDPETVNRIANIFGVPPEKLRG